MKECANRWTDNVFQLRSFVKNKFGMAEAEANKQIGIPADFDNLV